MRTARTRAQVSKGKPTMREVDIVVENYSSIYLLRPLTSAGREWLESHVADDAQWFGNALACEGRYVEPLVNGAIQDGLVLE